MGDLAASAAPAEILIAVCQELYVKFVALQVETGLDANGLLRQLLDLYDRVIRTGSNKGEYSPKISKHGVIQESDKCRRSKRHVKTKRRAPKTGKSRSRHSDEQDEIPEAVTDKLCELSLQGELGETDGDVTLPTLTMAPVHSNLPARRTSRKPATPKRKLVESDNSLDTSLDMSLAEDCLAVTGASTTPKRRRKNKPQKLVPVSSGEDNSASDQENGLDIADDMEGKAAETEHNYAQRKSRLMNGPPMDEMATDFFDMSFPGDQERHMTHITEENGDVESDASCELIIDETNVEEEHCPADGQTVSDDGVITISFVPPTEDKQSKARRKNGNPQNNVLKAAKNLYKCSLCKASFTLPSHLKRHVNGLHGKNAAFACRGCARPCRSELARMYHEAMICKLIDLPFRCENCHLRFETQTKVDEHKCSRDPSKPCICATCDYKTGSPRDLIMHVRVHSGEKSHKCDQCDFATAWRKNLKEHMFKHTGLKPYVCDICGFATNDKHNSRSHRATHTAQKDFMCEVCGEKFREARFLRSHQIVHTTLKPFKCELCNYSSKYKSNVRSHMLCHADLKKYVCEQCGQGCRTKSHMKVHQSTVHMFSDTAYGCKHCDYTATSSQSINSHMRKHTKKPKKPKQSKGKTPPSEDVPHSRVVLLPGSPDQDNQTLKKEMNIYRFEATHQDGGHSNVSSNSADGQHGDGRPLDTTFSNISSSDVREGQSDPDVFTPGGVVAVLPCTSTDPPSSSAGPQLQEPSAGAASSDPTRPQYEELLFNSNASQAETISAMMTLIRESRPR